MRSEPDDDERLRAASLPSFPDRPRHGSAGVLALRLPGAHRTAPHRTAPHRTAPHRTAPHRTAPHRTAPHRTTPHHTTPHHTTPHHTTPHLQILAQLLEYRPDGLSDAYRALFQPLLAPANWDRKGNCPALVRLLQAYLKQGAAELLPHLQGILGCFQKLLALKSTEGNAFALLESVLVNVPMETLQPYLPQLFQLLMMRLQQNQTGRFCKLLVRFLCMFVVKHGPDGMVQCLEGVQAGMTNMIINQVCD